MDIFIDIISGLLPFFILIIFLIFRGINNDRKEKIRKVDYYKKNEKPAKHFQNIKGELTKECNKDEKAEKAENIEEIDRSSLDKDVIKKKEKENDLFLFQESNICKERNFEDVIRDQSIELNIFKSLDNNKKLSTSIDEFSNSLKFSNDPLIQGIIFLEILDKPKTMKNFNKK
ncbi:hypothetical protein [Garciella nitratireducens]|uniref:hypothetical protein n=1 Tax=Garciella nitratireducens TaxID=218205 RepID=UPI000DE981EB|nr:hypothetical protein [Garciella nitratireducens]RBP45497.1 hypothetical protein DFR81_10229 [Garciella nitratireducens]